ncbi:hypothetical protein Clacol_001985 [Clathrus columnatus]|uniref:sn-1-specific diacylglycerol lipase n=1 Tax=Clathrus columnatus TaxID=1419009 RepID=A0AAV5A792_9AGAM|nr:hypothetical protein Clacol_001985 [Clathrus columnatus]
MAWGLLDIAHNVTSTVSTLTSVGFGVAKASTHLGFAIARSIVGLAPIPFLKTSLDHLENFSLLPLLLGESIASTSFTAASTAISNFLDSNDTEASFSLASFVTLVRNEWAEMGAAGRSVIEVARAVAAWAAIQGFTKEWSEDRWLQHTTELLEKDILPPFDSSNPPTISPPPTNGRQRTISRINVTEDVIIPEGIHQSQVVSADIGEKDKSSSSSLSSSSVPSEIRPTTGKSVASSTSKDDGIPIRSNYEIWHTLRRLSKIVLAGYGGAGLLFFGVPLRPSEDVYRRDSQTRTQRSDSEVKSSEEKVLVDTLEEVETRDKHGRTTSTTSVEHSDTSPSSYSWWNVLVGKHDREIFEGFAFTQPEEEERKMIRSPSNVSIRSARSRSSTQSLNHPSMHSYPSNSSTNVSPLGADHELYPTSKSASTSKHTAVIGDMRHLPRFWVLTDHGRRQVVLVVRGTMSFNDLAVDLTCEPAPFTPATMSTPAATQAAGDVCEAESTPSETMQSSQSSYPDYFSLRRSPSVVEIANTVRQEEKERDSDRRPKESYHVNESASYEVHGGMLLLARAMGCKGKPVHDAVLAALSKNPRYELILCGHSLGAGVATLLALMWADPKTCRTVPSSGLPPNRRVSVYCFAPPCVTSASLSRLCRNLITSFIYSYDAVTRLSLGSMRDMVKAASWLCEGKGEASTISLLRRALKGKLGFGEVAANTEEEKKWFIAVRKTLEESMAYTLLFPPGRVWWAVRNESLHPSHKSICGDCLRLFEVHHVEEVFRQIEFKGDMLSSHLPNQYDNALCELEL